MIIYSFDHLPSNVSFPSGPSLQSKVTGAHSEHERLALHHSDKIDLSLLIILQ